MKNIDTSTLGGRIASVRKAQKITQAELAKLVGIGQSSIALLESGSTNATHHAVALAQALQVPLQWLIHGKISETPDIGSTLPPPVSTQDTFVKRLISRREQCGLTQTQLAAKSGLSQATIGNLETGRNKGTKRILELAQALHVTPEWLLKGGSLSEATGAALRRAFAVPTKEQLYEQSIQRIISMEKTDTHAPVEDLSAPILPVNTMLPIISWHDKALFTPYEAHSSPTREGYFRSPFKQSRSAFWMRVTGDLMAPEYLENDLILVDPELTEQNNDDIVILDTKGKPGFVRLKKALNDSYIETLNPVYPDRVHKFENGSQVIGVVNGMVRRPPARK